jgi:hypothetical protein
VISVEVSAFGVRAAGRKVLWQFGLLPFPVWRDEPNTALVYR